MTLQKLKTLSDEVSEFHPLLRELFPLLQDIQHVDYTHGTNEKGADFVLTKHDRTLTRTEYIGVIAKLGKIHSNIDDIERQIDECKESRLVSGGKSRVFLSEVWVVNNDNITQGAQGKIQRKFTATKLKFISGTELNELVTQHLPAYWLGINPGVGSYLAELRRTTMELDSALSLLSFDKRAIYIDQDIYQIPQYAFSKQEKKTRIRVNIYDEIKGRKIILIEGGMGSGKSKLLRNLVNHYTEHETLKESNIVPILISYREFVTEFTADFEKLKHSRISKDSLEQFNHSVFLFLIDGIDELSEDVSEKVDTLNSIAKAVGEMEDIRVVLTSRHIEGLNSEKSVSAAISRLYLPPLTLAKTIEFLKQLCAELNLTSRIIEDIKKSNLFKQLPQSPIAAILLAKLINENPKELPSNLTELYSKYLELILGRWDVEKGLQSQKIYQAVDSMVMRLADLFFENDMEYMTLGDLKDEIKSYLDERQLTLTPEEIYKTLTERCEILSADTLGNKFYFKHKTFVEYFYAKKLFQSTGLNISSAVFDFHWINVVFFYLGLRRDDPELLTKIIDTAPESEAQRWLRIINLANFFLAAYATPYDIITKGIQQAMIEAARIYITTASGINPSLFTDLPKMHLLFILQLVLRESYSFEFFNKAMEESALNIVTGNYTEEEKAFALFFLDVTFIELGRQSPFDFLLEEYGKVLPIEISLAISHEGDRLKNRTRLMKRQDKKVHRLLESALQKQKIKELYDKPIKLKHSKSLP